MQDKLNIRADTPSPLLPQSSVQKGGVFSGTLSICTATVSFLRSVRKAQHSHC